ncbi:MAG: metallophosphoesterase family protein [Epsilonproteobacteria bacterium]|nr:metallophosphoesterase family protein [Campylobacterota bacterium]
MKIGIISDTHKKVNLAKDAIELLIEKGVEFIIHAGDIVEVEILDILESCGVRYVAVYGNNDSHLTQYHDKYNLVQEPNYFKLANTNFKLMHLPYYMSPDAEVVIFGHTHEFEVEYKGTTLFLNPGEVCARSKNLSEFLILNIKKKKFKVTRYTKKTKTKTKKKFKSQKFIYERKGL